MKVLLAAFLLPLLLSTGCKKAEATPQQVSLTVKGMTCEGCVSGITDTLKMTPGIAACEVSLSESNAVVTYDASKITPEQIEQRIDALQFEATLVKTGE